MRGGDLDGNLMMINKDDHDNDNTVNDDNEDDVNYRLMLS
jgi:hypothetical protein